MSVTDRIAKWYIRHVQDQANDETDTIRDIQMRAARTDEQVIRLIVWEKNAQVREQIAQETHIFTFRVCNGRLQELPDSTRPNGTIHLDVPVMLGLARGKFDRQTRGGGPSVHYEPFNPIVAHFVGLMPIEGDSAVLRNLELVQKEVLPRLGKIFRIKGL